eukprot:scaffold56267_cov48-Phaeocystis_antarctica.AAC.1
MARSGPRPRGAPSCRAGVAPGGAMMRQGGAIRWGSAQLSLDVRPCGEGHAREVARVLEEELRGGEGGEHGLAQAARGRAEGLAEGVVPGGR